MRELLFIILGVLLYHAGVAQEEKLNCIVFVNGKLPDKSRLSGFFTVKDSFNIPMTYPFSYQIGDIELASSVKKKLFSLPFDKEVLITLKYIGKQGEEKLFSSYIQAEWLKWSFIILRITTLKKGKYHFGISGPGISSVFIKQEYLIFDSYD